MKEKYTYNEDTLTYDKVTTPTIEKKFIGNVSYLNFIYGIIGLILVLSLGSLVTLMVVNHKLKTVNHTLSNPNLCKHDIILGSNKWKDSVFSEYEVKANQYLNRKEFEGTPIKGGMLSLAAENAFDSTGILLPVELCLAQCQWESGMGLKGRSPKNNPFNIGENDSGTVMWFDNTFDGVQSYFYYMCSDYLRCRTISELFNNFVNCGGHRYASGDYEEHVPDQYYFIVSWLENH